MNTPLIVTVEFDTAAARVTLEALEFAMEEGNWTAGDYASLQRAHDDLTLAMLEN